MIYIIIESTKICKSGVPCIFLRYTGFKEFATYTNETLRKEKEIPQINLGNEKNIKASSASEKYTDVEVRYLHCTVKVVSLLRSRGFLCHNDLNNF